MQTMLPCPTLPDRCELQHEVFSTLGDVRFRRSSTDGLPMMAMRLGEREAQLPLEALRRELAIGKDTADGRMLDLIGSALDYVSCLQPGDRLPAEICTGEASWKPSQKHIQLARTRLQLDLCAWARPECRWARAGRDERTLLRLADNEVLLDDVHTVCVGAAGQLGFSGPEQVVRVLEELSQELAFIEALRERLLGRVNGLCRRLAVLTRERQRPGAMFDSLAQVNRLMMVAKKQIVERFDDLDVQTAEIDGLLRNLDNQRTFIRSNRDWLYRTQRAWEPVLERWSHEGETPGGDLATLLTATYQFLAPRFMPSTAWQRPRLDRSRATSPARMTW